MKKERIKWQEFAEPCKAPKRQKKAEKGKEGKPELWAHLKIVNKELKNINDAKKG